MCKRTGKSRPPRYDDVLRDGIDEWEAALAEEREVKPGWYEDGVRALERDRIVALLVARAEERETKAAKQRRRKDLDGHRALSCLAVEIREIIQGLIGGDDG